MEIADTYQIEPEEKTEKRLIDSVMEAAFSAVPIVRFEYLKNSYNKQE